MSISTTQKIWYHNFFSIYWIAKIFMGDIEKIVYFCEKKIFFEKRNYQLLNLEKKSVVGKIEKNRNFENKKIKYPQYAHVNHTVSFFFKLL